MSNIYLFQTDYSIVGFVDRCPGATKDMNHYVMYKLIDDNWILFNDNLVQYQRNIGIVHRVSLVIYQKSSKTMAYSIGLCDLYKSQTSTSSTTSCTESKKTVERSQVIYKTKLTTHAEDLAGFLIFKISTNLINIIFRFIKLKCCGPDGYLWHTFHWRSS